MWFTFQFEDDYSLPVSRGVVRAVEPKAFRVQSSFHGHKGVPTCFGSELVLKKWAVHPATDDTSVYDFAWITGLAMPTVPRFRSQVH